MIVVMQCAARKKPTAGFMRTQSDRCVSFVADPANAPAGDCVYAHPDDPSDVGPTWRELLSRYNETARANTLGLLPSHALYQNDAYQRLADHVGIDKFYILSAGWGLLAGSFLTPCYDITFSAQADAYKRRQRSSAYLDYRMLPEGGEPILFFGSREYVPLFVSLTAHIKAPKALFSRSQAGPDLPGISVLRFETPRRTNWQYDCVNAFLSGKVILPFDA